jgi:hypothetical protein
VMTMMAEHLASRRGCVPAVISYGDMSTAFGSVSLVPFFSIYTVPQQACKLSGSQRFYLSQRRLSEDHEQSNHLS